MCIRDSSTPLAGTEISTEISTEVSNLSASGGGGGGGGSFGLQFLFLLLVTAMGGGRRAAHGKNCLTRTCRVHKHINWQMTNATTYIVSGGVLITLVFAQAD